MRALRQVAFDLRLARYYMWAQTDYMVYVTVHVPTGSSLYHLCVVPTGLSLFT